MKEKRCPSYVGVFCVSGSCPMAIKEDHEEVAHPKISCKDCWFYEGCEDCVFVEECELCTKIL